MDNQQAKQTSDEIHAAAIHAYTAAAEYGKTHPNPNAEEWKTWQTLCWAATRLHDAFLGVLQEERLGLRG